MGYCYRLITANDKKTEILRARKRYANINHIRIQRKFTENVKYELFLLNLVNWSLTLKLTLDMLRLTEILMSISNYISKYSSLILSSGFILLGIWVFFFPAELSRNAGIAMFIVGFLFGLLILRKGKTIWNRKFDRKVTWQQKRYLQVNFLMSWKIQNNLRNSIWYQFY